MNNRQIETSREIRLWITGVVSPVLIVAGTIIVGDPELRAQFTGWVKGKIQTVKNKLKKGGQVNA
jgi:hypothetical protein